MQILPLINLTIGFFICAAFIFMTVVSVKENEFRAARRAFALAILLPIPFIISGIFTFPFSEIVSIIFPLISLVIILLLLIPFGRSNTHFNDIPTKQIDERNTMFARKDLQPESDNYQDYYSRNPDKKELDDKFRALPGLQDPRASQYHPLGFASADASFKSVASFKPLIDGPINENQISINPESSTNYIKNWAKKLGAVDVGITELKDYHLYNFKGRKETYGTPVKNNHKFAIAFTVEMDREMIRSAPAASTVMESAQQYLESGAIAIQVAEFIRSIGYLASAHIDGNYQVVCPLVARDAGLGEIGRMGLLMTPKLGPRVRISVVTTDLPLLVDKIIFDKTMIEFCRKCKKCATVCPSNAIPFEGLSEIDGAWRWQVNSEACYTFWCQIGTDCSRCMGACPYSHPDNILHNIVRLGIKNSSLFRRLAIFLDDFFYGEKPAPTPLPEWMDLDQENSGD